MALKLRSMLGSYEVQSLLGVGGMGEVYRARDTRLGREVAIKVLPAERMADEGRRQRFVQEARAASALNHPNIVTIYEIESADGIDFIVMEYIPGKSLDALIPRQGMVLSEVLRLALPLADAVACAHAAGIVHRDLKPANVVVGPEGTVKILDFGLAKLVAREAGSPKNETVTEDRGADPLSQAGTIAGTIGYMSPEQATGQKVDTRSDIFSFGTLLYEIVTGRRAFAGNSTAETLAALLREPPKAPREISTGVPRDLEKLILRCLQKDVGRRFQSMADVRVELQEIKEESASRPAAAPARVNRRSWPAAGLAIVLLLTAVAWLRWRPRELEHPPPRLVPLTALRGSEMDPTFSPDGGQIAFAWEGERGDNTDIYLKMVGSSEMRRLTSDPAGDVAPSWSPDGRQIAFRRLRPGTLANGWRGPNVAPSTIHLVSPVGGPDRRLSHFLAWDSQLSWSPDGRWVAAAGFASATEEDRRASGIYLIPVQGGEPLSITSPSAPTFHAAPAVSRDGRHLAYASCFSVLSCHVDVVELGRDYVPTGPPRRLTRRPGLLRGLAWARDGISVIYADFTSARLWRASIVGDHPPEKIELAGMGLFAPATAASVDRLAFVQGRGNADIYRFDVGHAPEPLLVSSSIEWGPHLSPNGRRIAFMSARAGDGDDIWLADADGSNPTQLTRGPGISQGSARWSPDGRRIAFDSQGEDGHWDIWTIDADGGAPSRLTRDPGDEQMPSWTRDGYFIYFGSDRAGAPADVWRIPAKGGAEERLTHGGGTHAFESVDGKTLFFLRGSRAPLCALPLSGGPERKLLECVPAFGFAVGAAGVYHFACRAGASGIPLYLLDPATGRDRLLGNLEQAQGGLTVSPDGKTILYVKAAGEGSDLMMIENVR